ncbi:MAG TPA: C-terminal helicase domain-containing protein, partial [Oscillospiraceae bacterium]|nr:C-terminal helicase domain-containing protein [Oscillospiraceae bacterium]
VTIARSRRHIQQFYDTTEIGAFPERLTPKSYHVPITHMPGAVELNEIFAQLSALNLAVYAPMSYLLPSRIKKYEELYDTQVDGGRSRLRQVDREKSLRALMTTNLLKRLESSVHSFRLTLQSLQDTIVQTLTIIEHFKQQAEQHLAAEEVGLYSADSFTEEELDADNPFAVGKKIRIDLQDLDLPSWEFELRQDLAGLNALIQSVAPITPEHDAKLQHLAELIQDKIEQPLNEGNRKILIFSAFADTTEYLYQHLTQQPALQALNLNFAQVTGAGNPKSTLKTRRRAYDFQEVLTLFSPVSKEKDKVLPNEPGEIDILIATDCISEGQNLQDCDYLINYDIHWNPVRIVQRFGRIDRIGSINQAIQLVNYWPDISLDEYINLKERVENRMAIVDVTATGDDNLLDVNSEDAAYRKKQLKRLQTEVIDLEDTGAGISITDLGLNEFRMDILSHVQQHGSLEQAPKGLHAVIPAGNGLEAGVIFGLRNLNPDKHQDEQNRLHPHYLVYISEQGEVLASHLQAKQLLDLLRAACKGRSKPLLEACQAFNQRTHDGRDMQEVSDLLNQAIHSMVEHKEESDIDSLFSGQQTTALVNSIQGLDDFELLGFIVVQDVQLEA